MAHYVMTEKVLLNRQHNRMFKHFGVVPELASGSFVFRILMLSAITNNCIQEYDSEDDICRMIV